MVGPGCTDYLHPQSHQKIRPSLTHHPSPALLRISRPHLLRKELRACFFALLLALSCSVSDWLLALFAPLGSSFSSCGALLSSPSLFNCLNTELLRKTFSEFVVTGPLLLLTCFWFWFSNGFVIIDYASEKVDRKFKPSPVLLPQTPPPPPPPNLFPPSLPVSLYSCDGLVTRSNRESDFLFGKSKTHWWLLRGSPCTVSYFYVD
jgi:hypothetical protein